VDTPIPPEILSIIVKKIGAERARSIVLPG
jgi:hypothetical protein